MAGYLSLWLVYHGFRLVTGKEGMGYGDFKLFAALLAWLGYQMFLPIMLLSALTGAITGIALIALGRHGRQAADSVRALPGGRRLRRPRLGRAPDGRRAFLRIFPRCRDRVSGATPMSTTRSSDCGTGPSTGWDSPAASPAARAQWLACSRRWASRSSTPT